MNFSEALAAVKHGDFVSRQGWNGKGLFIYLVPGHTFNKDVARGPVQEIAAASEVETITYRDHIDMRYVDGSIGVWFASMSDMLADDWFVVSDIAAHMKTK